MNVKKNLINILILVISIYAPNNRWDQPSIKGWLFIAACKNMNARFQSLHWGHTPTDRSWTQI